MGTVSVLGSPIFTPRDIRGLSGDSFGCARSPSVGSTGEELADQPSHVHDALSTALSARRVRAGEQDDRRVRERNSSGITEASDALTVDP